MRLRIGYLPDSLPAAVPRALRRLAASVPAVQVELESAPAWRLVDDVRRGRLDAAITSLPAPTNGLRSLPLGEQGAVVALPAMHPHAGEPEIAIERLAPERIVVLPHEANPAFRNAVVAMCHAEGLAPTFIEVAEPRVEDVLLAVVAGRGPAILPESVTERYATPGVRFVPLGGARASLRTVVLTQPDHRSLATAAFLRALERTTTRQRRPSRRATSSPCPPDMELRHLRYFVAVADERSFTRAAERLWIAQPGLSTQIRRLEGELGIRLFERHTRGVDLTEAGELFLDRARVTLAAAEAARSTGRDLEAGLVGSIRLGVATPVGWSGTTALLESFARDRPDVEVTVSESYGGTLMRDLRDSRLDAVLAPAMFATAELLRLTVGREPWLVLAGASHRLAGSDCPVEAGDLQAERLVVTGHRDGGGLRPSRRRNAHRARGRLRALPCRFGACLLRACRLR